MTRALGTDISFWNGAVNFNTMRSAGASFVFCKVGQRTYADNMFSTYWPAAKAAGLLRGGYWYLDWRESEISQANLFCSLLATDSGELPPVLDLEMDPAPYGYNAAIVNSKAQNFMNIVESTLGRLPMFYTGYYYSNPKESTWSRYPLWLPWYAKEEYVKTPPPWVHWDFWQYSSNGNGPQYGAQGLSMDMNYFNGTEAELQAWANIEPEPPTPPHPDICPTCGQPWPDDIPIPPEPPTPPELPKYKTTTYVNVRYNPHDTNGYIVLPPNTQVYVTGDPVAVNNPAGYRSHCTTVDEPVIIGYIWTGYLVKV